MPYAASAPIVTTPSAKPESPNSNPAQLVPEFWLTFWPELTIWHRSKQMTCVSRPYLRPERRLRAQDRSCDGELRLPSHFSDFGIEPNAINLTPTCLRIPRTQRHFY